MWTARPEVLLPLLLVGAAFAAGWGRLRRRGPRAARPWRLAVALGGAASVAVALLSPLDPLAHRSLATHMVQHLLLMTAAPALLLLAEPLPALLWALPGGARGAVAGLLVPRAPVREVWRALTRMPVAWLIATVVVWAWHVPAAYDAALGEDLVHDLEHLSFFGAGLLFWWPIVNPPPRVHGHVPYHRRIVYVVLACAPQALLGLILMMSPVVLYPAYETASRLAPRSLLADQARGGVVMWGTGTVVAVVTLMVLLYRLLDREDRLAIRRSPAPADPGGESASPARP